MVSFESVLELLELDQDNFGLSRVSLLRLAGFRAVECWGSGF